MIERCSDRFSVEHCKSEGTSWIFSVEVESAGRISSPEARVFHSECGCHHCNTCEKRGHRRIHVLKPHACSGDGRIGNLSDRLQETKLAETFASYFAHLGSVFSSE